MDVHGRKRAGHSGRPGGGKGPAPGRERVRAAQLAVCLALFLAVFIGKGVFPAKLAQTGSQVLEIIRANTDFRAAFADLGRALAEEGSVLGGLGDFCVAVFAPAAEDEGAGEAAVPAGAGAQALLSARADQEEMTARLLGVDRLPPSLTVTLEQGGAGEPREEPAQPDTAPQVGTMLQAAAGGEELPEGYSGDWLSLGDLETVTPVMGVITSPFGYRDHPISGKYALHGGVDIGASAGAAVTAFADGVVEYIGESEDLGLYLQLIHDNGVKSFYAHCSQLCVHKGQQVSAGEKVALVGSTGQSTGPHLHFELKLNGVRLDPAYYIDSYQTA